jgi:hypothetical protein
MTASISGDMGKNPHSGSRGRPLVGPTGVWNDHLSTILPGFLWEVLLCPLFFTDIFEVEQESMPSLVTSSFCSLLLVCSSLESLELNKVLYDNILFYSLVKSLIFWVTFQKLD